MREFGVPAKTTVAKKWILSILALFNPIVKETMEMIYQVDSEYLFDSSKYTSTFDHEPTSYKVGIAQTVRAYKELDETA